MQNMALRIRISKLLISCAIDNVYTLQDIEDYSQQVADDIRMIEQNPNNFEEVQQKYPFKIRVTPVTLYGNRYLKVDIK